MTAWPRSARVDVVASTPAPLRVLSVIPPTWLVGAAVGAILGIVAGQAATRGSLPYYLALIIVAVPFAGIIVGGLRRLLLAALVLDIVLRWDINLFSHGLGPSPEGLNVSLTTICIAGLYAIWLADALSRRTLAAGPAVRASLIPLLYILSTSLSLVVAADKMVGVFNVVLLVQTFVVFFYIVTNFRDWSGFRFIMITLVLAMFLESSAVILSYLFGHDFAVAGLKSYAYADSPESGAIYRPGGTIGSPNVAGSFLGLGLAPILMMLKTPVSYRLKIFTAISFGLGTVALVLTFSRGGWLAFVTSMLVVLCASRMRHLFRVRFLILAFTTVIIVILPFRDLILARLNASGGTQSRIPLMQIAWQMIEANPLLGVGVNNFFFALPNYAGPEFSGDWLAIVHNQFLLIWSESGFLALLTFVAFILTSIWHGLRAVARAGEPLALLAVGLTASMVGMVPNMFVERFVNRPQIGLLWLIAALLTAISLSPLATSRKAVHDAVP